MRLTSALLVAAAWLTACGEPLREVDRREIPSFEATSGDGAPVSLEDLRGDAVLLNVWATWCAPCRQEIPFLAGLQTRHGASGFRVIGVSIDAAADREKVIATAPAFGINYDIWLDPEERIAGVMRYGGLPASMLIGRDGVVRWTHVGVIREDTPGFNEALREVLASGGVH